MEIVPVFIIIYYVQTTGLKYNPISNSYNLHEDQKKRERERELAVKNTQVDKNRFIDVTT